MDWFLLAAAFAVFSISTLIWVYKNQAPPSWDPSDHIRSGIEYYRSLSAFDLRWFAEEFFAYKHYYPPFYHLLLAAVFLVAGPSVFAAAFANLILLAAMIYSLYRLGCALYSREAGLIAAIVAPTYHVNAALLHESYLDFALMSWAAVSLLLLHQTDQFAKRGASALLGIALGIGMLCKQPFVFFLGPPVAYAIIAGLWNRRLRTEALKNVLIALIIAAATAGIWYVPHFYDVVQIYKVNQAGALSEREAPLFSYFSNMAYIYALASQQLQLPLFAIFLIGLVASAVWYKRESIPLYLCIAGGLTAFSLIANKDARYTIPILPAVALLSACWIGRIKAEWIKRAAIAVTIILGAVNFSQAHWPINREDIYYDSTNFRWAFLGKNFLHYDGRPSEDDWSFPAMLEAIGNRCEHKRGIVRVGVVPNLVNFNPSAFALYGRLWNLRDNHPFIRVKWLQSESKWRQVKRCRYIIIRDPIENDASGDSYETRFNEWVKSQPERFVKVGEMPLASLKAKAIIYEQTISPQRTEKVF